MIIENKTKKIKDICDLIPEQPVNIEAEKELLCCLINDSEARIQWLPLLREDDFYHNSHRIIYKALVKLDTLNLVCEIATLIELLNKDSLIDEAGGIDYLVDLSSSLISYELVATYVQIVQENSLLRSLMKTAFKLMVECTKSKNARATLEEAKKTFNEFDVSLNNETNYNFIPLTQAFIGELNTEKTSKTFKTIKTGFNDLDYLTDGFHPGELIILAARPSLGKTALATNILTNFILQGKKCAFFSLEMSSRQIIQRIFSSLSGISLRDIIRGELTQEELDTLTELNDFFFKQETKVFLDDSALLTPEMILAKCSQFNKDAKIDFVVIDYLQLMTVQRENKNSNRVQEITYISRSLKLMAKELQIPILVLSQLSRGNEQRRERPRLSDLRESGAIEQDADVVVFIHRQEQEANSSNHNSLNPLENNENISEIIIGKNRNGAIGTTKFYFDGEHVRFLNIDEDGVPIIESFVDLLTRNESLSLD